MSALRAKIRRLLHIRAEFLYRLLWGLVICLACWGLYEFVGNKLLRPVARQEIERLTGAKVKIDSVDFKSAGFVRMNYVIIGSPQTERYENRILRANKVDIRFSLASMLRLQPKAKRVVIKDFIFNAQYNTDTRRWNLGLLRKGKPSEAEEMLPNIEAKRGTLKLSKVVGGKAEDITVMKIDGELVPARGLKDTYSFYIESKDSGNGDKYGLIRGIWQSGPRGKVKLNGRIPSTDLPVLGNRWELSGLVLELTYDHQDISIQTLKWFMLGKTAVAISGAITSYAGDAEYNIDMHVKQLLLASEPTVNALVYGRPTLDKLRPGLRKFLEQYNPRGWSDVNINSQGRFAELAKSKWAGTITCRDISVRDKKLPYLLEHMAGTLEVTEKSVVLDNLQCKHGDVDLVINGQANKVRQQWVYDIGITSPNMLLAGDGDGGSDLWMALTKAQKRLWWIFTPTGRARINYKLTRSPGGERKATATVDLLGAQAVYQHFPYPLNNLTGRVYVEPDRLTLTNVISQYEGRRIMLSGHVTETTGEWPRFNITIDANDVPIDSTLKAALPAKQREFYENFEVDALTDVHIKVFPNEVGRRLVEYIARARIKNASLIYEKFPLPLTNVNAEAILTPDLVRLESMTGKSGGAEVKVAGRIWPVNESNAEPGLCLSLDAEELELDDKWLKALPAEASEIIAWLRPRGRVNISANLNVDAGDPDCPEYELVIECLGTSINFERFPYPIENVRGTITVAPDNIELRNLRAPWGADANSQGTEPAQITLNGNIVTSEGRMETGQFSVYAHNILLDDKLAEALPRAAKNIYRDISPAGRIDLNIDEAGFRTDSDGQRWIDVHSELVFKQCGFGSRKTLTQLDAKLTSDISYELSHGLWEGQADFRTDSLKISDRLVDNLHAAIIYDPQKQAFKSKDFTARCYGGKVIGDIELSYTDSEAMAYLLQLAFDNVEIKEILSVKADDAKPSDSLTSGQADGVFNVAGTLGQRSSRIGRLNVSVSKMELTRRSLLGKVLAAMQLDKPTDFIFSNMTAEAYLKENEIVFERIYMSGQSMVLQGSGRADLESNNVDLNFTASGKRIAPEPSLLESLAKGLGSAVMQVEVRGDIDRPRIETTTLPVIKRSLEIFGSTP
jgi:hypothetical protein